MFHWLKNHGFSVVYFAAGAEFAGHSQGESGHFATPTPYFGRDHSESIQFNHFQMEIS
jgi:hypothetical protein